MSDALTRRARELEQAGLRGLDALHVASAEAGATELLITPCAAPEEESG
jgi:hypothetical protein